MTFTTRTIRVGSLLAGALLLVVILAILLSRFYQPVWADNPAAEAGPGQPAPLPEMIVVDSTQVRSAAVSSILSYYFISGAEFTPNGNVAYSRQATGCVNQMPLNIGFTAGVHLPNGSVIQSITLYSFESNPAATARGTAYFIFNDGLGLASATLSVESPLNNAGYTQTTSSMNNPWTINNQSESYVVEWRKLGSPDSTLLSLCGVRIAYYAPLGAIYLPAVVK